MRDLLVKLNDILRGLDSIIEAHDYPPVMACELGNHRIQLLDLRKQMEILEIWRSGS